jgi:hypothetical protein
MILILFIASIALGDEQELQSYPNHYLILIDASYSTIRNDFKEGYINLLKNQLQSKIYESGFGPTLPKYDPVKDFMTVEYFGICVEENIPAWDNLKNYNILKQYLHPVLISKSHVTKTEFSSMINPDQFYMLTLLAWSKQLALWNYSKYNDNVIKNHIFIVIVTDGEYNKISPIEEVGMVERHGNPSNIKDVEKITNNIDDKYSFSIVDEQGKRHLSAWRDTILDPETNKSIYIEAYEIISNNQEEKVRDGNSYKPFIQKKLFWNWSGFWGANAKWKLQATLDSSFLGWLNKEGCKKIKLELIDGNYTSKSIFNPAETISIPIAIPGNVYREQKEYTIKLSVLIDEKDELLGRRAFSFTYPNTIMAPPLIYQNVLFWLTFIVGLIIFGLIIYFIYYRFYATHIHIELPRVEYPYRIMRNRELNINYQICPTSGLETFGIILPSKLIRFIFYRKARLELISKEFVEIGNNILTSKNKKVYGKWRKIPNKQETIRLEFVQGKQKTSILINYPKGIE